MTGSLPNGNIEVTPVIGINFGNSFASLAVFTREGQVEYIANEDGERQIACAIAFQGEEVYIGNEAKNQLVKNPQNTILGFRNLLGKKFSTILQNERTTNTASIIQHPEYPDVPAYRVKVLQPAPAPLPITATNTPAASHATTPQCEPISIERILTPSEVTTIFLKSLVRSAESFLGQTVHQAVIAVPTWFDQDNRTALERAAEEAGLKVLQFLGNAAAVAAATAFGLQPEGIPGDRIQLVIDLGFSSLELALLSFRDDLAFSIATASDSTIGGHQIDEKLVKFFAKAFTKQTKMKLTVCPATEPAHRRAEAKLRLAVEHTKRTLSASPGSAACSVESLLDGVDFTGSINRLRFDMEVRPIYQRISAKVRELLEGTNLDLHDIDEVVYVGGSTSLPGLDEELAGCLSLNVISPFRSGTVVGGGIGDPTTILARGCAMQGMLLASLGGDDTALTDAFSHGSALRRVRATTKSVGLVFPGSSDVFAVLPRETALPARRRVRFDADLQESMTRVGFEVWELREEVRVDLESPQKLESDDGDEDEEEEEEMTEVKTKIIQKDTHLGSLEVEVQAPTEKGRRTTKVEVEMFVHKDGALKVSAWEVGRKEPGVKVSFTAPAS